MRSIALPRVRDPRCRRWRAPLRRELARTKIIATERLNHRVVHLALDGAFLGVVNSDLSLPAALTIDGDDVIVGELNGA
jgi:hypothetical protein